MSSGRPGSGLTQPQRIGEFSQRRSRIRHRAVPEHLQHDMVGTGVEMSRDGLRGVVDRSHPHHGPGQPFGQREIVVRALKDPLAQSKGIAGATELGDQRVVLILDISALRQLAMTSRH